MNRIDEVQTGEGQRLRAIRLRSLRDAPDAFGGTYAESAARSPDDWERQVEEMPTFVAVMGAGASAELEAGAEADVGIVRGATFDGDEDDALYLISMWVAPEARGQGVGEALIAALAERARELGYARMLLDVGDENAAAQRLYARMGFVPTGRAGTLPPPRDHVTEHQMELRL